MTSSLLGIELIPLLLLPPGKRIGNEVGENVISIKLQIAKQFKRNAPPKGRIKT